ncbi:MAG TPA: carboxylesterase/lipase family protein [Blastocatellia bacterium]|nr:carboxylesterase/lipase family protein [Blastocatellia bacterium]
MNGKTETYSWKLTLLLTLFVILGGGGLAAGQVRIDSGLIQGGTAESDAHIRVFKGIPYAAPPTGDLRWKAPQPVKPWKEVLKATEFGPRCMQGPIYADMIFRDKGLSEDCLYLNVWTPAKSAKQRLPVMVWIYGGGFQAGAASEPRQDGEHLSGKGVIVVSFNYRLGVFGFLAHPDLTKESGHNASGNYGLLDQVAALEWVRKNIAAFGGDPHKVTIFGESAGSFSVSALMASPLARGLFQRAIGESGALFSAGGQPSRRPSLSQTEQAGAKFAVSLGANSIAELRTKPADEILQAALKSRAFGFSANVDGYMLPGDVYGIYAAGEQSHVPLLAGWNADEARAGVVLAKQKPTVESFTAQLKARFGDSAQTALKVYPATSDGEAVESAANLASDGFIGYSTWKWVDMQYQTGKSPVYCYSFDRARPVPADTKVNGRTATAKDIGARHAAEIEYVFGALKSSTDPWETDDWKISSEMMIYWTNFAKTGNPNGSGLAKWPAYDRSSGYQVMHINSDLHAGPDSRRPRYEFLDSLAAKSRRETAGGRTN